MKVVKSRTEIALTRLLNKCQEMANNTEDLSQEWRLPKFVSACEEMLSSLPSSPSSNAPSQDTVTEFQNKIKFLKSLLPPPENEDVDTEYKQAPPTVPMPLPQGSSLARDTVSKQIYQKMAERQHSSTRDQLLSSSSNNNNISSKTGVKGGVTLDKILSDQREEQEKIAEEMILLTKSLKEQSSVAGDIIRKDTIRLEASSAMADSNLDKLKIETERVGEFSARGNCRCWIWLMMVLVVFTFIGMVLMMRLFSKKVYIPPPSSTPVQSSTIMSQSHLVDEL